MINLISNFIPGTKKLMETGEKVDAKIMAVKPNFLRKIGCCPARVPFNIHLQYTDSSGNIYHTKTTELWDDPQPLIKEHGLEVLPVFVDPNNFKKNYIDLSVLKGLSS